MSCCSIVFFGTSGMCGCLAAVTIVSVSLPSFFCRRTKGFTYCGLMIVTWCPSASSFLAHSSGGRSIIASIRCCHPRDSKVVRRHVDEETIEKIVDELFEIRGDKRFRDTIE